MSVFLFYSVFQDLTTHRSNSLLFLQTLSAIVVEWDHYTTTLLYISHPFKNCCFLIKNNFIEKSTLKEARKATHQQHAVPYCELGDDNHMPNHFLWSRNGPMIAPLLKSQYNFQNSPRWSQNYSPFSFYWEKNWYMNRRKITQTKHEVK